MGGAVRHAEYYRYATPRVDIYITVLYIVVLNLDITRVHLKVLAAALHLTDIRVPHPRYLVLEYEYSGMHQRPRGSEYDFKILIGL